MVQTAIGRPQFAQEKLGVALGHLPIIITLQHPRTLGEGGQHQPVPGGQYLFVAPRMYPLLADGEQFAPRLGQFCARAGKIGNFQNIPPFKVTFLGDVIRGHKSVRLRTQHGSDLVRRPDEKPALLPLAVGVLGGIKAAGRTCGEPFGFAQGRPGRTIGHLADDVIERLLRDGAFEWIAGHLPGVQVDAGQLGVVVEHFFKMGHEPMVVHRVAMEAAADLVVHAPIRHRIQGQGHHVQCPILTRDVVVAQQEF